MSISGEAESTKQDDPASELTAPSGHERKKGGEHDRNVLTAAKSASITFVGKVTQYGLSLIFVFFMARMLGAEQYGLYRLAFTITPIIAALSLLGFDAGMRRFIPIARKQHDDARIRGVMQLGVGIPAVISILSAIAFAGLADVIAVNVYKAPELAPVLRLSAMAIPVFSISLSFSSIAMAFKRMQYDVYTQDIGVEAIKIILSVTCLFLGFGVVAVTAAFVVAAILGLIALVILVNRVYPVRKLLIPGNRDTKELLRFSLPMLLSMMLAKFGRRTETLILGMFTALSNVGVYASILNISSLGMLIHVGFRNIATPIVAELHSQGRIDELKKFYQTLTKWGMISNLPVFLVIALFSDTVLSVLGEDFRVGSTALVLVGFGYLFDASTGLCGVLISYSGHSKLGFYNSLTYLAVSIVLDLLFIPWWGLIGAAVAGSITIILINALRVYHVYNLIDGILPFNRTFWKPIVAAIVAGGVTYVLKGFVLTGQPLVQCIVLSVVMCIIYVVMIVRLKLSYEDRLVAEKVMQGRVLQGFKSNVLAKFSRKRG